ncbi:TRAP transporter large permease [Paenibacillus allorhizosphaerae]|uniref:C4-dicarboxylate TRAP transporter large permease protein DctM n=1 Tax=Paenibacillus allorhizosphaerae TaxID=2849866 RepID=A0ABN7TU59_9BACL|nr:TRAP transporter large permease [Paenibacillus allorhizosphaerae]CAG7655889.1 C4-dicarboxylate TRAP transporter large permease protein DctM [Paenibacillus allorhizosphaerae]
MEDTTIAILILCISFVVLMLLRFPISLTLALSTLLTIMYLEIPLAVVGQRMIQGMSSYSLLTIPFFILAGHIMSEGKLALRIVNLAQLIVGGIRGGLALVNTVACMFFGNISGSAVADVSSIGSVMIPMMKKKGYDTDYAVGVTVSSAIQGVVVPPSHNLVLYSLAAGGGISIASLFLAGIVPGIILCLSLMATSYVIAIKRGYTKGDPVQRKDIPKILRDGFLSILTAVIILGGIFTGWFTATESGALACLYAFILTFIVYRDIPVSRMWVILKKTFRTVSMVMFLIAASDAFSWLLAFLKIPSMVTDAMLSISDSPFVIMLIINILLLVLGAPMDMAPLIMIMTPILLPVVTQLGMDPVHFGIIMMLNLGIGLLTPPVGTVLFVGCAIGKISISEGTKAMMPFFYVMCVVLLILTYVPDLVMWLPNMMKN